MTPRRVTPPPAAGAVTEPAPPPLATLLARTTGLGDLLPHLHQHALESTGGERSLLFEHNPRNGILHATSGFGLEMLPSEPWVPGPRDAAIIADAFGRGEPVLVTDADREMPDLAAQLETRAVLLLALRKGSDRIGLLAVGFAGRAPAAVGPGADHVADAFVVALEICRLRQREELHHELRRLLEDFAQGISTTLQLGTPLAAFCEGASRLFGADRTSVWLHDRRARLLVLRASSDGAHAARGVPVDADEVLSPVAAAMRHARAEIALDAKAAMPADQPMATCTVTVPLRGCRRALGTVVFEGVRIEAGDELALLDRADEIGRQLSSAVENLQLLDDLMRSRRQLQETFDSIAHLVVVYDAEGHIVHANNAFASRVGKTRDQLVERPVAEFVGPELAAWLAALAAEPDGGGTRAATQREIVDSVLKGPFTVTVTDLLNRGRERAGSVLVARDLTPETMLEAEREELRRRLTQSEKLAALGQFVAGIAHELNNPLQGVLGHLELLRVTGAFPKNLRRDVQTISREAERAAKIVRNLLLFAGSRRIGRRAVSLNGVLQKVVALRAAACRAADIEVVRHYDDKLPRVQSDPLLLHQVFLNMIINAEDAVASTRKGGRIDITTAVAPGRPMVVVTVRDTGRGMAPDVLSHMFEPFYTTKDVGQGTGLGLAITYGIVQDHGGHISAANHPEGGAVFTVELPMA
ncbi:MAG: ATP-binding protein, partial [Acidobacteriota bacterium]